MFAPQPCSPFVAFLLLWAGSLLYPCLALAQHQLDPETWIEMRKMFRQAGPEPSIAEDLAALSGAQARKAAARLLDRGLEVLPAAHAALLNSEQDPRVAVTLLALIGPLGDRSSVPVLLELLGQQAAHPLRRDLLLTLARLPATDEAAAYIARLATATDEPWRIQRMAYTWYGLHRDTRGRPFAEALRHDPDPEKRTAALFVLARLGDSGVLTPIGQMLEHGAVSELRSTLLLALAEVASVESFDAIAPPGLAWSDDFTSARRYAQYRAATPEARAPVCENLLRSTLPGMLELAVACLLDGGHAQRLRPHAALSMEAPGSDALVRNAIRKAGWQIIDTEDEFSIVPRSEPGE